MTSRPLVCAALAMTLAALSNSAFAQPAPQGAPRDIDVKPYLAEAYAQGQSQAILLQRMQAGCPAETKRAVMIDKQKPVAWFGCWRQKDGKVEIAFEDGDFLSLERDSLVWLSEVGT